jgi:hypothetical protein
LPMGTTMNQPSLVQTVNLTGMVKT